MGDPQGLAIIIGTLAAAALATLAYARLVGLRLAATRPTLALSTSVLVVPACIVAAGVTMFQIDSAAHPTSDLPPMALLGTFVLAILSLLASIPVSFMVLRR